MSNNLGRPAPDANTPTSVRSSVNLYVSLLRTGVPALVGWLVAVAARYGLNIDPGALDGVLAPTVGFGYYAVFRLAEHLVSPGGAGCSATRSRPPTRRRALRAAELPPLPAPLTPGG
ncbi:hypothetical protein ACFQ2M_13965 [Kitasatospora saccharophila]|uniref:hypothetical protein n=1 Tax=Kitasatospora saccharophila TaxID=407973 RepID=UPI003625AF4E